MLDIETIRQQTRDARKDTTTELYIQNTIALIERKIQKASLEGLSAVTIYGIPLEYVNEVKNHLDKMGFGLEQYPTSTAWLEYRLHIKW